MMLGLFPTTALGGWDSRTQSVYRLTTGWTVRGSNTDGGEILHTLADWLWGPPGVLYNWYRLSFPGVKRPGRDVNHPLPCSKEVKSVDILQTKHCQCISVRHTETDCCTV